MGRASQSLPCRARPLIPSSDSRPAFRLAGLIVNWAITERTALKDLIDKIPPGKLEKIKERREKAAEEAAQKAATKSN